ncbi:hypothetical protein [Mycobacterium sp. 852002-51057_SCH5723018]|uniref:hypothetical protein n=1 Tax=Mycobacterium sp. 852002-51057_SCH5723018 TaxID=1834094 RepID=UPI000800EC5D|nr:hypothetical protein [Mycobacterium sp. 852002-51057_SCH5723018]OBG18672.1 hypothetical protein A5764_17860 [Mycobacterium sp. 852002-51057_SCH5723018]
MADDELDSLYLAEPEAFTARRTELVAAAKKRGDDAAAKRISAARKPTTAAWIVNRLALSDKDAKRRLADLGDRLRAAHAEMDGEGIRELSAEQHKLIGELARAAFEAADAKQPSSAVRDDVTSTLQAAVADPDVTARLGRLAKPERWSGFGSFGDAVPVLTASRKAKGESERSRPQPAKQPPREAAAQRRLEKLTAAVTAAEHDKAEADATLEESQAERDAARQRRDEALVALRRAEREFSTAEDKFEKAKRASRAAADLVKEAKAQLKRS